MPATLTVELPALLAVNVIGQRELTTQGDTVQEALDHLLATHPKLRNHLYTQDGAQREHVNIFHNNENLKWFDDIAAIPCKDGDRITIIQAVSGG